MIDKLINKLFLELGILIEVFSLSDVYVKFKIDIYQRGGYYSLSRPFKEKTK